MLREHGRHGRRQFRRAAEAMKRDQAPIAVTVDLSALGFYGVAP